MSFIFEALPSMSFGRNFPTTTCYLLKKKEMISKKKKGRRKGAPKEGIYYWKRERVVRKTPKRGGMKMRSFVITFLLFSSFELKKFFFHMCDKEREGGCCFRKTTFGEKKKLEGGEERCNRFHRYSERLIIRN